MSKQNETKIDVNIDNLNSKVIFIWTFTLVAGKDNSFSTDLQNIINWDQKDYDSDKWYTKPALHIYLHNVSDSKHKKLRTTITYSPQKHTT